MLYQPSAVLSTNFLYQKGTFSAEASEIGLGRSFHFGQVYSDACDEGFTIISKKTGNPAVFALDRVEEREGDILAWHFKCVTPKLKELKAVIFND